MYSRIVSRRVGDDNNDVMDKRDRVHMDACTWITAYTRQKDNTDDADATRDGDGAHNDNEKDDVHDELK